MLAMRLKKGTGFGSFSLEYAALGLLMLGPRHGYGLYQEFSKVFDKIWNAGQTNFYLSLSSLEDHHLVEAETEAPERGPARKVYHLNDAGRAAFVMWLHQPVQSLRAARVEMIAKLRFYDLLKLPGANSFIDLQIAAFTAMLDEWEHSNSQGASDGDPFQQLVTDFRVRQARFIVEWLRTAKTRLF